MFEKLLEKLEYQFQNIETLEEALTHPSFSEDLNYERLEFLGDSVLSLVITTLLIDQFKGESEGDLAKRRSSVINGKTLHKVAENIDLGSFLFIAEVEENLGGRHNPKILENAIEAIIGAIYLDGGLEPCKNFITKYWLESINNNAEPPVDSKTFLQEWSQNKGYGLPIYTTLDKTGPDHKPCFVIEVKVGDFPPCTASAFSKKETEQEAALKMIQYIKENDTKS